MSKMSNEWLRRIAKIQYYAGGTWYDAKITDKYVTARTQNNVTVNTLYVRSQTTDNLALTITKVRLIDTGGDVAGEISENITKTSSQGVITLWEFPLYEITA